MKLQEPASYVGDESSDDSASDATGKCLESAELEAGEAAADAAPPKTDEDPSGSVEPAAEEPSEAAAPGAVAEASDAAEVSTEEVSDAVASRPDETSEGPEPDAGEADEGPPGAVLVEQVVSKEFDAPYYLARYSEIVGRGVDPLKYYLEKGWSQGHEPAPWFSTGDYLDLYPDVESSGLNPFYHYLAYGRAEGRVPHSRSQEWDIVCREFDYAFYLSNNPDIAESIEDAVDHYNAMGWRERRDPTPWFSTTYYLDHNDDIRNAGVNPFAHYLTSGRSEERFPAAYLQRIRINPKKPTVSVIVPNFNHANFLRERLDSILEQTYEGIEEILVLDDKSSDNSVEIIEEYREKHPERIRAIYNDANSGSVFRQWRKGVQEVKGDLVWICESDDSCERDFVKTLAEYFLDPSIMIAFGKIQFIDNQNVESFWLDIYRESAAPGIWSEARVDTAFEWFRGPFAIRNVIPNVGGCLFRRQTLAAHVWDEAERYRVLGDWFLYGNLACGGRIAFDPRAVSYFRQHSGNTSVRSFTLDKYYVEHAWIASFLRQRFGVSDESTLRFYSLIRQQFVDVFGKGRARELDDLIDLDEILSLKRTQRHIVISMLGLEVGGAEVFAIHLANKLLDLGFIVSVLTVRHGEQSEGMRGMLDPRIAVYERALIDEIGLREFIRNASVDVVNSHYIGSEFLFFADNGGRFDVPYVVTLHGSYEVTPVTDAQLLAFLRGVDYWVYTAAKNLRHLDGIPIDRARFVSLPNALTVNPAPFPLTRADLGADEDTVIFGIASRAIKDKGWREAIRALSLAQSKVDRRLMLLLCGEGPEFKRLLPAYGSNPNVRLLGFYDNIHGFYRLCDCCLLPTRFLGESFPLSLVQSLQVGTPIIATDVGEISTMLVDGDEAAGILLRPSERSETFIRSLAAAMVEMSDDSFRSARKADAVSLGVRYDLEALAKRYVSIFGNAAKWDQTALS